MYSHGHRMIPCLGKDHYKLYGNQFYFFIILPKGVACHVGFTLAQWNDGEVDQPLSRATFTSENKPLSVDCEVSSLETMIKRGIFAQIFKFL